MSWKNILKANSLVEEMKDITDLLEEMDDDFNNEEGDIPDIAHKRIPKLKGKLSEKDYKYIDGYLNEVFKGREAYSNALNGLITALMETSDEYKEETNSSSDMRYTPSGGGGKVHPAFKDYKLKDDEMWGEPSGDGFMTPVKIDNQYGAEY